MASASNLRRGRLSDIDGYFLARGGRGSLDNGSDCFCDLTAAADNHTHFVGSNAESELNVVTVFVSYDLNLIRSVNDRTDDVYKKLFEIHLAPLNYSVMPAFFKRALTVSVG